MWKMWNSKFFIGNLIILLYIPDICELVIEVRHRVLKKVKYLVIKE